MLASVSFRKWSNSPRTNSTARSTRSTSELNRTHPYEYRSEFSRSARIYPVFFLSPGRRSGERTEERGHPNYSRTGASSPQPSPPSDGGEGALVGALPRCVGGHSSATLKPPPKILMSHVARTYYLNKSLGIHTCSTPSTEPVRIRDSQCPTHISQPGHELE